MSIWRRIITPTLIYRNLRQEISKKSIHNRMHKYINITSSLDSKNPEKFKVFYNSVRCKSKKQTKQDDDDKDDEFDDDSSLAKDSKVIKFSSTSMRIDMILKSALGVSRNKVEQMFYESKIRINERKVLKKSVSVKQGDEVDVIKMISPNNPDHLYVARVEILNVEPQEESIKVTARRFKHLLIENYETDSHKGAADSET